MTGVQTCALPICFGRMYLGASELFVNAPQTVGSTLGAEFERRAGVKPSVEDVKVIGTGLGLAAAGAAGTEQAGQNIGTFEAFGPAGILRGAVIGGGIGFYQNQNHTYPQPTIFCRENNIFYSITSVSVNKIDIIK